MTEEYETRAGQDTAGSPNSETGMRGLDAPPNIDLSWPVSEPASSGPLSALDQTSSTQSGTSEPPPDFDG